MKITSSFALSLSGVAACALLSTSTVQAQLIINGGFEVPDTAEILTVNAGGTEIAPWVIGFVSVDVLDGTNPFAMGAAYEGNQFLDLDGTPGPGSLMQSFATVPGLLYDLSFAYSHNYSNGTQGVGQVRVFDTTGDRLTFQPLVHNTGGPGNLDWRVANYSFTATQTSSTLEFQSLSGGGFGGLMLDGVQVNAVPEPTTALFGFALVGALAGCRQRRAARSAK